MPRRYAEDLRDWNPRQEEGRPQAPQINSVTQAALNAKLDDSQAGTFGLSWLGTATLAAAKTLLALVKGDVGLGNVDNTSDANKPISTAQAAAIATKLTDGNDVVTNPKLADMPAATIKGRASGAGTGDPTDLTSAQVFTILGGTTGTGAVALESNPSITSPTMTGGAGMTGSWNRTLLLDASFPTLVLRSNWPGTATDHGAIGYDGSVDTLFFFVGATTADATVPTAKLFQISPTGFGYATGTGGAVTQITSKATGVTLNKTNGSITMHAAALAASTSVAFTLTNSTIAATDVVNVTIKSGATSGAYVITVQATAAGSCSIMVRNVSAGALSEALVLNFAVLKAVTA